MMPTIVWNPNRFHVINVLSKGIKFNADHCITDLLIPLTESCKAQVGTTNRKLIIHGENACPQTGKMSLDFLKQNVMKNTSPSALT
jgi:hypothetical protein